MWARYVHEMVHWRDIRGLGNILRHEYSEVDVASWADRLVPFLDGGLDAFVFFRHDETGENPGLARSLAARVRERQGASART